LPVFKQDRSEIKVTMKTYDKLIKFITFNLGDVVQITGNESTATSLITRMMNKKYIVRIRKDLYTCIDLSTGDTIANKYQIATAINDKAYVSHHSAFEFYGLVNQVYNIMYVSSEKQFNEFEFNGITYKHINSVVEEGVVKHKNTNGIRVTDIERTFVDSANLITKIGGIEELIKITEAIDYMDAKKILFYLNLYNKKVLYQKVGYLIENYYKGESFDKEFFSICLKNAGNSVRYLTSNNEGIFNAKWNLVIPNELLMGEFNEYI